MLCQYIGIVDLVYWFIRFQGLHRNFERSQALILLGDPQDSLPQERSSMHKHYLSDLNDDHWTIVEPLIPVFDVDRPRTNDMRKC